MRASLRQAQPTNSATAAWGEDDEGLGGSQAVRMMPELRNIFIRSPTRSYEQPQERRSSVCNRLFITILSLHELLPPIPTGSSPLAAQTTPPNTEPYRLYTHNHGNSQHVPEWAQHYKELPEHHQLSATIRFTGQLPDVRAMGCLHRSCPDCQRISARWRQGERFESSDHRRYV